MDELKKKSLIKRLTDKLRPVEKKIGRDFSEKKYLLKAMTHSSFANENSVLGIKDNERLEFLGDAVLDLIIAKYLFSKNPDFREGDLSKLRSALVRQETLASIARRNRLHQYIYLGKGEEKNRTALRDSVLSNALEALIGAVYIDGGYKNTEDAVLRLFSSLLSGADEVEDKFNNKNRLIDLARKKFGYFPEFRRMADSGPEHEKVFKVSVYINNCYVTYAKGTSIKKAEQSAARNALGILTKTNSSFMKKAGRKMMLKNKS